MVLNHRYLGYGYLSIYLLCCDWVLFTSLLVLSDQSWTQYTVDQTECPPVLSYLQHFEVPAWLLTLEDRD